MGKAFCMHHQCDEPSPQARMHACTVDESEAHYDSQEELYSDDDQFGDLLAKGEVACMPRVPLTLTSHRVPMCLSFEPSTLVWAVRTPLKMC